MTFRKRSRKDPRKILVIHGGALGDVVLFVPTLRLIRSRYPSAEIVFLSSPYSGSVVRGLSYVNQVVLANRKSEPFARYFFKLLKLRFRRFDLLIDVHGTMRSRQQRLLIGARRTVAMTRGDIVDHLYGEVVDRDHSGHMVHEYTGLLRQLGVDSLPEDFRLELPVTAEHRNAARNLLESTGVSGPFVVIHPTTSGRPPHELWQAEKFGLLIDKLAQLDLQVVISSDAKRATEVSEILTHVSNPVADLTGKTDPLVLAAILELSSLYLGYNTGPMHIAAAVHTRVVAFMENPGKVAFWKPLSERETRTLIAPSRQIDGIEICDTRELSVEQVFEAVKQVLAVDRELISVLNT